MSSKKFVLILIIFLTIYLLFLYEIKSSSVNVTAIKPGICGNNIKEINEECDGPDLDRQTCVSLGYSGGTLSCNSNCTFKTSQCTTQPPAGGGGGGGSGPANQFGSFVLSGRAQPNSNVTLMSDGQIRADIKTNADGRFEFTLVNLSPGMYIFTLYAEDSSGRRTTLHSVPVIITAGAEVKVSSIFLAPTIDVDKTVVKKGDTLRIFGQTAPKSDVLIVVSSEEEKYFQIKAEDDGSYLYAFNTVDLEYGNHLTKSKAVLANQLISPFSRVISFDVSTATSKVKQIASKCPQKGDLNSDCKVNLIDFSIAAYWYKKKLGQEFLKTEANDLNGDGKVDLVDFSILAYYYTG